MITRNTFGSKLAAFVLFAGVAGHTAASAASVSEVKEAFNSGINATLKVMQYEKKLASKPVERGYCIQVDGKNGKPIDAFTTVKLESLSLLYMKNPEPMSLQRVNAKGQTENVFCFSFIKHGKSEAELALRDIRRRYGKIDQYNPRIVYIGNPKVYSRALPGLGTWHEDQTPTINLLTRKIHRLKHVIAVKNAALEEIRNSLTKVFGKESGNIVDRAQEKARSHVRKTDSGAGRPHKSSIKKSKNQFKSKGDIGKKLHSHSGKYPVISIDGGIAHFKDKRHNIKIESVDGSKRILTIVR